jgi:hypothetical protein
MLTSYIDYSGIPLTGTGDLYTKLQSLFGISTECFRPRHGTYRRCAQHKTDGTWKVELSIN